MNKHKIKSIKRKKDIIIFDKKISKDIERPQPAVFFDRDGVLIKEDGYIVDQSQIIFNDKLIEVMKELKSKGILVGIITNQPLVAQGRINNFKHELIRNFIINYLSKLSAIDLYYECKKSQYTSSEKKLPTT